MTYAYIVGGVVVWALGCMAVLSLALAAGSERPRKEPAVVGTGAATVEVRDGRRARMATTSDRKKTAPDAA